MKRLKVTVDQLKPLQDKFANIKRLDPLSDQYKALKMTIEAFTDDTLMLIVDEKINFLSAMAWLELQNRGIKYALSRL